MGALRRPKLEDREFLLGQLLFWCANGVWLWVYNTLVAVRGGGILSALCESLNIGTNVLLSKEHSQSSSLASYLLEGYLAILASVNSIRLCEHT
jgi:hypothetical protein